MVAGPDSNLTALEFTWKCVDFKKDYMDFTLNFTFYGNVSIFRDMKDSLKLNFYGNQYFGADDGQTFEEVSS